MARRVVRPLFLLKVVMTRGWLGLWDWVWAGRLGCRGSGQYYGMYRIEWCIHALKQAFEPGYAPPFPLRTVFQGAKTTYPGFQGLLASMQGGY